ncbi:hypothetical protein [Streptomyces sp. NPDC051636]|uniref:hypothetical protein n=1 Tax=Streptomyces sp. NPDC051636 TaxID=3365663 RepID=UPI00379DAA36
MTRSPRWRGALASAAVLVAVPLAGAQTAHAQSAAPYPPPPNCVTLTATAVHAGDRLGFRGTGFAARQRVEARLSASLVFLRIFRANAQGDVTGSVNVPRITSTGKHVFSLTAIGSPPRRCSATVTVLPPRRARTLEGGPVNAAYHGGPPSRSTVADTGSEKALALGGTAAAMIAAGGGTMLAVRRRRSS